MTFYTILKDIHWCLSANKLKLFMILKDDNAKRRAVADKPR